MRTLTALLLPVVLSACLAGSAHEAPSDPVPSRVASQLGRDERPRERVGVAVEPLGAMPSVPPRPVVPVPTARVVVVASERGGPEPSGGHLAVRGQRIVGTASWYCGHGSRCTRGYPGGLYAAAGPKLRVGDWRGRTVNVLAGGRTVRVRLVDWCACPQRLLDLYSDAFQRLAPLSRGLVKVTVTW